MAPVARLIVEIALAPTDPKAAYATPVTPEMSNPTPKALIGKPRGPMVKSWPVFGDTGVPVGEPCLTRLSIPSSIPNSVVDPAPAKLLV